jgi:hypothetical protein
MFEEIFVCLYLPNLLGSRRLPYCVISYISYLYLGARKERESSSFVLSIVLKFILDQRSRCRATQRGGTPHFCTYVPLFCILFLLLWPFSPKISLNHLGWLNSVFVFISYLSMTFYPRLPNHLRWFSLYLKYVFLIWSFRGSTPPALYAFLYVFLQVFPFYVPFIFSCSKLFQPRKRKPSLRRYADQLILRRGNISLNTPQTPK